MMDWTFGGGKSVSLTVFIDSLFKKSEWKSVKKSANFIKKLVILNL